MQTTEQISLGFVTFLAADAAVDALTEEGYEAEAVQIGDDRYQILVAGDLDEVTHADLSGMVRGINWTMKTLHAEEMI